MGSIDGRLGRLEREAGEHSTTVSCPKCGETFRHAGDLALDVVAAQWARATGTDYEEAPTVSRVLDHPHELLVDEVLRDLPAFGRAR